MKTKINPREAATAAESQPTGLRLGAIVQRPQQLYNDDFGPFRQPSIVCP